MKGKSDQGMTMLEVMVSAVMLAIFMAAFVAIMQLSAKLIKGIDSGGFTASELALARSIATQRLNSLASSLAREEYVDFEKKLGIENCLTAKAEWNFVNDDNTSWSLSNQKFYPDVSGTPQKGFIDRVCIYSTKYKESTTAPGLYVVQAEPKAAGPLLQPLRVLFCRPQNFCLQNRRTI